MSVFNHHLYEYKKGLRSLVLHTGNIKEKNIIEKRLKKETINYYIQKVNSTKINVFFGDDRCIKIIKQIRNRLLSELTEEEDFILGIMLGYDRLQQCERYLKKKKRVKIYEDVSCVG